MTAVPPDPHLPDADLDAVIVNYRTPTLLQTALESWEKHHPVGGPGPQVNLTVVDVDPDLDHPFPFNPADWPGVTYLRTPRNVGFGAACNLAAMLTAGAPVLAVPGTPAGTPRPVGGAPVVAFFNADTALLDNQAIPTMLAHFDEHPDCGIAGPLQTDHENRVTHGGIFGSHAAPAHRGWREPVNDSYRDTRRAITVSGSAFFVRRSAFDRLACCDLYRERIAPRALGAFLDTPHYFEETWVAYHAWAHRIQVWYVGAAQLTHLWNKAPNPGVTPDDLFAKSRPIFRRACQMHGIEHD